MEWICLAQDIVEGYCEHGNEPLGSVKCREENLHSCRTLKLANSLKELTELTISCNTLIRTTVRNKYFSCSILLCTTTTCFGRNAPSSGEAEYNTSNYKSLLNCNRTYNKT
jgi:hypothetical protein